MVREKETWKPVPGYESRYLVSSQGRVKSLIYLGKRRHILRQMTHYHGYRFVFLAAGTRPKSSKKFFVHRLVAMAFFENSGNLPVVNHRNGDKADNRLGNLEWFSYQDNSRHYFSELAPERRKKQIPVPVERRQPIEIPESW